ncbi:hypothetical protein UFOVP1590_49 [uncultured Caudovirales phage]|uniref:Uncharacterized protein n=1 Tax=uncultured Caudovirales phage TaxID=2100421 RepID=A0A6J5SQQ6_9CAUD|nr:hypothetical protein UFOVP1590_49 [uncultured Caudovirales phage]
MGMMTGVVEQISSKEVNTKWGAKPTYSFKVNGSWVSTSFKNSGVNVGDEVSFDGENTTYGLQTKSVSITAKGAGGVPGTPTPTPAASKPTGSYGGSRVFPIPALHGDRSIVRQNALARATELYVGARGGKPFDLDVADVSTVIISLARKFEAYTAGDLDMAEAVAESEKGE